MQSLRTQNFGTKLKTCLVSIHEFLIGMSIPRNYYTEAI